MKCSSLTKVNPGQPVIPGAGLNGIAESDNRRDERDQQKWNPVLRPIALQAIDRRMISSPNRLHFGGSCASPYSEFAFIQSATARPIAGPESSWMKWEPGTVTSAWFFQVRQNSLTAPIRMAPGSALTNSFGMSRPASPCE